MRTSLLVALGLLALLRREDMAAAHFSNEDGTWSWSRPRRWDMGSLFDSWSPLWSSFFGGRGSSGGRRGSGGGAGYGGASGNAGSQGGAGYGGGGYSGGSGNAGSQGGVGFGGGGYSGGSGAGYGGGTSGAGYAGNSGAGAGGAGYGGASGAGVGYSGGAGPGYAGSSGAGYVRPGGGIYIGISGNPAGNPEYGGASGSSYGSQGTVGAGDGQGPGYTGVGGPGYSGAEGTGYGPQGNFGIGIRYPGYDYDGNVLYNPYRRGPRVFIYGGPVGYPGQGGVGYGGYDGTQNQGGGNLFYDRGYIMDPNTGRPIGPGSGYPGGYGGTYGPNGGVAGGQRPGYGGAGASRPGFFSNLGTAILDWLANQSGGSGSGLGESIRDVYTVTDNSGRPGNSITGGNPGYGGAAGGGGGINSVGPNGGYGQTGTGTGLGGQGGYGGAGGLGGNTGYGGVTGGAGGNPGYGGAGAGYGGAGGSTGYGGAGGSTGYGGIGGNTGAGYGGAGGNTGYGGTGGNTGAGYGGAGGNTGYGGIGGNTGAGYGGAGGNTGYGGTGGTTGAGYGGAGGGTGYGGIGGNTGAGYGGAGGNTGYGGAGGGTGYGGAGGTTGYGGAGGTTGYGGAGGTTGYGGTGGGTGYGGIGGNTGGGAGGSTGYGGIGGSTGTGYGGAGGTTGYGGTGGGTGYGGTGGTTGYGGTGGTTGYGGTGGTTGYGGAGGTTGYGGTGGGTGYGGAGGTTGYGGTGGGTGAGYGGAGGNTGYGGITGPSGTAGFGGIAGVGGLGGTGGTTGLGGISGTGGSGSVGLGGAGGSTGLGGASGTGGSGTIGIGGAGGSTGLGGVGGTGSTGFGGVSGTGGGTGFGGVSGTGGGTGFGGVSGTGGGTGVGGVGGTGGGGSIGITTGVGGTGGSTGLGGVGGVGGVGGTGGGGSIGITTGVGGTGGSTGLGGVSGGGGTGNVGITTGAGGAGGVTGTGGGLNVNVNLQACQPLFVFPFENGLEERQKRYTMGMTGNVNLQGNGAVFDGTGRLYIPYFQNRDLSPTYTIDVTAYPSATGNAANTEQIILSNGLTAQETTLALTFNSNRVTLYVRERGTGRVVTLSAQFNQGLIRIQQDGNNIYLQTSFQRVSEVGKMPGITTNPLMLGQGATTQGEAASYVGGMGGIAFYPCFPNSAAGGNVVNVGIGVTPTPVTTNAAVCTPLWVFPFEGNFEERNKQVTVGSTGTVELRGNGAYFSGQGRLTIPYFQSRDLRPRYTIDLTVFPGANTATSSTPQVVLSNGMTPESTTLALTYSPGQVTVYVRGRDTGNVVTATAQFKEGLIRIEQNDQYVGLRTSLQRVYEKTTIPAPTPSPLMLGGGSIPIGNADPYVGAIGGIAFYTCLLTDNTAVTSGAAPQPNSTQITVNQNAATCVPQWIFTFENGFQERNSRVTMEKSGEVALAGNGANFVGSGRLNIPFFQNKDLRPAYSIDVTVYPGPNVTATPSGYTVLSNGMTPQTTTFSLSWNPGLVTLAIRERGSGRVVTVQAKFEAGIIRIQQNDQTISLRTTLQRSTAETMMPQVNSNPLMIGGGSTVAAEAQNFVGGVGGIAYYNCLVENS